MPNFFAGTSQKSMLGEMLVRKSLISREQLKEALSLQTSTAKKLGEIIVSLGLLTEGQLARALQRQKRYRFIIAITAMLLAPFAPTALASAGASPTVHTASVTTNRAPIMRGTPTAKIAAGSYFSFQPAARDPEGKLLKFRIKNKPSWASFDATTGTLFGTPNRSQMGTYRKIQIIASDGKKSTAMKPFTVRVLAPTASLTTSNPSPTNATTAADARPQAIGDNASTSTNAPVTIPVLNNDTGLSDGGIQVSIIAAPSHGSASLSNNQIVFTPANQYSGNDSISYRVTDADGDTAVATIAISISCTQGCPADVTLSWSAPTTRADGSPLTNLAGYLVHYGTSHASYTHAVDVGGRNSLTHTLQSLPAGTYYFSVTAYDTNGNESSYSTEVSRTIH